VTTARQGRTSDLIVGLVMAAVSVAACGADSGLATRSPALSEVGSPSLVVSGPAASLSPPLAGRPFGAPTQDAAARAALVQAGVHSGGVDYGDVPSTGVTSMFKVPLVFATDGLWVMRVDSSSEVGLGYGGTGFYGDDGDPYVTIGIPYGFGSAASVVRSIERLRYPPPDAGMPVKEVCPGLATPTRAELVGLSGYTLDCSTDRNIDYVPIYPKNRQGALNGVPASLDAAGDWFIIPKGGPYVRFFVADVGRTTIIISIAGAGSGGGPGGPPTRLSPASVAAFKLLDLTFGP
jgi:hypothetical protein